MVGKEAVILNKLDSPERKSAVCHPQNTKNSTLEPTANNVTAVLQYVRLYMLQESVCEHVVGRGVKVYVYTVINVSTHSAVHTHTNTRSPTQTWLQEEQIDMNT